MYELKKNGKLFMSKFVGTGPSSYEKRVYRAVVSQRMRNTDLETSTLRHPRPKLGSSMKGILFTNWGQTFLMCQHELVLSVICSL